MFESLLAPWRAKFRLAISATACYAIAGVAGAVAFGFGLGALYSWLAQLFSPIIACLIIAGAFLLIWTEFLDQTLLLRGGGGGAEE